MALANRAAALILATVFTAGSGSLAATQSQSANGNVPASAATQKPRGTLVIDLAKKPLPAQFAFFLITAQRFIDQVRQHDPDLADRMYKDFIEEPENGGDAPGYHSYEKWFQDIVNHSPNTTDKPETTIAQNMVKWVMYVRFPELQDALKKPVRTPQPAPTAGR